MGKPSRLHFAHSQSVLPLGDCCCLLWSCPNASYDLYEPFRVRAWSTREGDQVQDCHLEHNLRHDSIDLSSSGWAIRTCSSLHHFPRRNGTVCCSMCRPTVRCEPLMVHDRAARLEWGLVAVVRTPDANPRAHRPLLVVPTSPHLSVHLLLWELVILCLDSSPLAGLSYWVLSTSDNFWGGSLPGCCDVTRHSLPLSLHFTWTFDTDDRILGTSTAWLSSA